MKLRLAIIAVPVLLSCHAGAQLAVPSPGLIRYPDSSVHLVTGIPGALLAQVKTLGSAVAVSFSARAALWASPGEIRLLDASGKTIASYAVDEPAPVLSVADGPQTALAWLPSSKTLLTWSSEGFSAVAVDASFFPGAVTSVSFVSAKIARLLLVDAHASVSTAQLSVSSGAVVSIDVLPGVRGPAFSIGPYIVSFADRELAIDSADGRRRTLALPTGAFPAGAPVTAEKMSEHWTHLSSRGNPAQWALFLDDRQAVLSCIPVISGTALKGGAR